MKSKMIAIVVVSLMAFAVLAAQTVTAQSATTIPTVLIGQKATFTKTAFNVHGTAPVATVGSASSKHGDAAASKDATFANAKGTSYAWVGLKFRVSGFSSWDQVKTKYVRITATGTYSLQATSTPGNAYADVQINTGNPLTPVTSTLIQSVTAPQYADPDLSPRPHDTFGVADGALPTKDFQLSQLSTGKPGECEVIVLVSGDAMTAGPGPLGAQLLSIGSASANLESLQISWL